MSAPSTGPMAMPRKVAAPMRPSARERRVPVVEVAGAGRGHRQDGAGAGALDDATEDEHLQRLRSTTHERACSEDEQRQDHQVGQAEAIGGASSQGHGRDVGHQVGSDDPRGTPQLGPAGKVEEDVAAGPRR